MRMLNALTLAVILLASSANAGAQTSSAVSSPAVAVAPQYDTTHVYVAAEDLDRFVTSFLATFGGSTSKRSEEHTSELQSLRHLVCRLLLEKKKKKSRNSSPHYIARSKDRTDRPRS